MAGLVGQTEQAVREAVLARHHGYHAGLLSLSAFRGATDAQLLDHCRQVAEVVPLFGFYMQPAVGGRELGYDFWRRFLAAHLALIPQICAGAGPYGELSQAESFHWLVAPHSTSIQTSPVHSGLCADPAAALERLLRCLVRLPASLNAGPFPRPRQPCPPAA